MSSPRRCRQYCPPTRAPESISATRAPELAALVAAARPAGPAPTTAMSYPGSVCEVGTARSQLCADLVSRLRLDQACPTVGPIVDRDQAVEAHSDAAEQAAGTVVHPGSAPPEMTSSNERRSHSLTGLRADLLVVEVELEGSVVHDALVSSNRSGRNGVRSRSSASPTMDCATNAPVPVDNPMPAPS